MCDNLCLVPGKKPGEYFYACYWNRQIIKSIRKCCDNQECLNYKSFDLRKPFATRVLSIDDIYSHVD